MKSIFQKTLLLFLMISLLGCNQNKKVNSLVPIAVLNQVYYAKGLSIFKYPGYSIVKVENPWPNASKSYTYILHEKNGIIPDSLKQNTIISVPVKTIVVTSTTHIPSLEMLGVENSLIGFPNTNYISSFKVRKQIDARKVRDVGNDQSLNTEVLIDLAPDVIIGHGIDNNNPTLDNLQKSGLKVLLNGDWNEQTPLGKAEWIKFFGVLYDQNDKANAIFKFIESEYKKTTLLALKETTKPTVLSGAIFENHWYLPQGNSWFAQVIKDASAHYLWEETKGTGSLSLSFETVFDRAQNADYWIGLGEFTALNEMTESNPHYKEFKAFKNKNIYSYSTKKGSKGGVLFYELAPNRPDLVLKDILKIIHPELLPKYQPYFFERLP